MAKNDSDGEEAITKEEIEGTAPLPIEDTAVKQSTKRNAFSQLMSPKTKVPASSSAKSSSATANFYNRSSIKPTSFNGRDGLGAYIEKPESYPASRVVYHNNNFVAINDLFPKAAVHTLLLPRLTKWNKLHPFDAFNPTDDANAQFLASVQAEALKLKKFVASELQRRYGKFSMQDKLRESILNGETEWDNTTPLPEGRNWEKEVMVGIHTRPSMNHLHVHVLSRDMFSECLKHRKHYNSFNTPFLVDVSEFPLKEDDERLHPGAAGFMEKDMKCWRCGKSFGNKFKQLKEHLAEEFEEWKKE